MQGLGNGFKYAGLTVMTLSTTTAVIGLGIDLHAYFNPANTTNVTLTCSSANETLTCPEQSGGGYSYYRLMELGGIGVNALGLGLYGIGAAIHYCGERKGYQKVGGEQQTEDTKLHLGDIHTSQ